MDRLPHLIHIIDWLGSMPSFKYPLVSLSIMLGTWSISIGLNNILGTDVIFCVLVPWMNQMASLQCFWACLLWLFFQVEDIMFMFLNLFINAHCQVLLSCGYIFIFVQLSLANDLIDYWLYVLILCLIFLCWVHTYFIGYYTTLVVTPRFLNPWVIFSLRLLWVYLLPMVYFPNA